MVSKSVQDYIKKIDRLQRKKRRNGNQTSEVCLVSTNALAEALDVKAASVTNMIKRLAQSELVHHTPYQGISLKEAGKNIAAELTRNHRLLELYLHDVLEIEIEDVHAEVELFEHGVSQNLIRRIDKAMGFPKVDPHGHMIPAEGESAIHTVYPSLFDLEPGKKATVVELDDQNPARLRNIIKRGVSPLLELQLLEHDAIKQKLTISVDGKTHQMCHRCAKTVSIKPL